ncbi:MAG: hypothetical protein M9962_14750 [Oligoflexia bacterium]|nr:hypothetical protein [Oligoflexia bacterium]
MKKSKWKKVLIVIAPVVGILSILGACSSTKICDNDVCYDREISSVDPYQDGEIAAWGSEKRVADEEKEAKKKEFHRQYYK